MRFILLVSLLTALSFVAYADHHVVFEGMAPQIESCDGSRTWSEALVRIETWQDFITVDLPSRWSEYGWVEPRHLRLYNAQGALGVGGSETIRGSDYKGAAYVSLTSIMEDGLVKAIDFHVADWHWSNDGCIRDTRGILPHSGRLPGKPPFMGLTFER